jgi:NADH-quinone oxidoreductase subunit M
MILSTILLLLLLGSVLPWLVRSATVARLIAILFAFLSFAASLYAYTMFEGSGLQLEERYQWIPSLGISYHIAVDGLSLPLVILTTLLALVATIYGVDEPKRDNQFYGLIMLTCFGTAGVFMALDLFLFFVFWEIVLIPMYFLIAIWGGPRKDYASFKFIIYTHIGSVIMILAFFAIHYLYYLQTGIRTFDLLELAKLNVEPKIAVILFIALLFGFFIKMPIFPFHTWLPAAHVEAPTSGSVLLAGILLKMGGYGLFRIPYTFFPEVAKAYAYPIAIIAIVTIFYGALAAMAQEDYKSLIALSSVSHMGYVLLGAAALTPAAITGAIFQMFAHGVVSPLLFIMAGTLHHKAGTRLIHRLGGVAHKMPVWATFMVTASMAGLALPFTASFVAEFTVLIGALEAFNVLALFVFPAAIVTAGYFLYALRRAVFGPFNADLHIHGDVDVHEFVAMFMLVVAIIYLGIYPIPLEGIIDTFSVAFAGGV